MELIYTTGDLSHAEELSSVLTEAGVVNHVSGSHSAQLAGFLAARTPSSIGVWLTNASDVQRAHQVMLSHGFLEHPIAAPPVTKHGKLWLGLLAAMIVLGLAALVASGD